MSTRAHFEAFTSPGATAEARWRVRLAGITFERKWYPELGAAGRAEDVQLEGYLSQSGAQSRSPVINYSDSPMVLPEDAQIEENLRRVLASLFPISDETTSDDDPVTPDGPK